MKAQLDVRDPGAEVDEVGRAHHRAGRGVDDRDGREELVTVPVIDAGGELIAQPRADRFLPVPGDQEPALVAIGDLDDEGVGVPRAQQARVTGLRMALDPIAHGVRDHRLHAVQCEFTGGLHLLIRARGGQSVRSGGGVFIRPGSGCAPGRRAHSRRRIALTAAGHRVVVRMRGRRAARRVQSLSGCGVLLRLAEEPGQEIAEETHGSSLPRNGSGKRSSASRMSATIKRHPVKTKSSSWASVMPASRG